MCEQHLPSYHPTQLQKHLQSLPFFQKDRVDNYKVNNGLIAEIFLQHIEHQHIAQLSMKHKINFFRYVDDILKIFDPSHSSIQTILADFNTLHPNQQFTAEMEENNTINYLDITIHRTPTNWKTVIYRKPTFTDTIITHMSNHPSKHKYTAVKFLYNRLRTYDLQPDEYLKRKTPSTTFCTTVPFRDNHINCTTLSYRNSNRIHTHQHKKGPRSPTLEKKPHSLPTYSNAPT